MVLTIYVTWVVLLHRVNFSVFREAGNRQLIIIRGAGGVGNRTRVNEGSLASKMRKELLFGSQSSLFLDQQQGRRASSSESI